MPRAKIPAVMQYRNAETGLTYISAHPSHAVDRNLQDVGRRLSTSDPFCCCVSIPAPSKDRSDVEGFCSEFTQHSSYPSCSSRRCCKATILAEAAWTDGADPKHTLQRIFFHRTSSGFSCCNSYKSGKDVRPDSDVSLIHPGDTALHHLKRWS